MKNKDKIRFLRWLERKFKLITVEKQGINNDYQFHFKNCYGMHARGQKYNLTCLYGVGDSARKAKANYCDSLFARKFLGFLGKSVIEMQKELKIFKKEQVEKKCIAKLHDLSKQENNFDECLHEILNPWKAKTKEDVKFNKEFEERKINEISDAIINVLEGKKKEQWRPKNIADNASGYRYDEIVISRKVIKDMMRQIEISPVELHGILGNWFCMLKE